MIISVFDRVENIVGKGEIARYEQFLLFPQCFHKASFPEASKGVIVWEWVNLSSANAFNLVTSRILSFDKGLMQHIQQTFLKASGMLSFL